MTYAQYESEDYLSAWIQAERDLAIQSLGNIALPVFPEVFEQDEMNVKPDIWDNWDEETAIIKL